MAIKCPDCKKPMKATGKSTAMPLQFEYVCPEGHKINVGVTERMKDLETENKKKEKCYYEKKYMIADIGFEAKDFPSSKVICNVASIKDDVPYLYDSHKKALKAINYMCKVNAKSKYYDTIFHVIEVFVPKMIKDEDV